MHERRPGVAQADLLRGIRRHPLGFVDEPLDFVLLAVEFSDPFSAEFPKWIALSKDRVPRVDPIANVGEGRVELPAPGDKIIGSSAVTAAASRRTVENRLAFDGESLIQIECPKFYRHTISIMATTGKIDALLRLARKGLVRARDLDETGIPRAYLKRLCDRGLLEQVDRGLYRLTDAPVTELHSLAEVGKRVPHAIVCLLSALQVHGLTTEMPHAVWVLIDRHARMPKLSYPRLEVVRASGLAREHGVESRTIEGVCVRLTKPAKTVADCFRYRRHVGLDVALTALRDYLRKYRGGVDALVEAARADRVYALMRPYLEALA